MKVLTLNNI